MNGFNRSTKILSRKSFSLLHSHLFLACDHDFGLIKRKLCLHDRSYTTGKIAEEVILKFSNNPGKFQVFCVNMEIVFGFPKLVQKILH